VDAGPLTPPVLCLVTPGTSSPDLDTIREAARGGINVIQIREPRLDARSLVTLVRAAIDAVAGYPARVVVNDRLDVALAAGAAGVHLRGDSIAAADARALAPAGFLIGRSVHSVSEAAGVARGGGCDYLLFGTVFESASKPPGHAAAGVETLGRVCAAVTLPVLAIGGVTLANADRAAAAGAAGIAAIGLFARREQVADTVRAVRRLFDTCYPQRK
jgi:thiamine-phosphate pyrophosphorylase